MPTAEQRVLRSYITTKQYLGAYWCNNLGINCFKSLVGSLIFITFLYNGYIIVITQMEISNKVTAEYPTATLQIIIILWTVVQMLFCKQAAKCDGWISPQSCPAGHYYYTGVGGRVGFEHGISWRDRAQQPLDVALRLPFTRAVILTLSRIPTARITELMRS